MKIWSVESGKVATVLNIGGLGAEERGVFVTPDLSRVLTLGATSPGVNPSLEDFSAKLWKTAPAALVAKIDREQEPSGGWADVELTHALLCVKTTNSEDAEWRFVPLFASYHDLLARARTLLTHCLNSEERTDLGLDPVPPRWCIEQQKYPYGTSAWREWLKMTDKGQTAPLPTSNH